MPHLAEMHAGHAQPPGQRFLPRRDDQRVVAFPGEAADLGVAHEPRVGPDAVVVETEPDARRQRHEVAVIDEHHRDAEDRRPRGQAAAQPADLDVGGHEHQDAEQHANRQVDREERGLRARPRDHGLMTLAPPAVDLGADFDVDDDEEQTECEQGLPENSGKLLQAHRAFPVASRSALVSSSRDSVGSKH
jgi:hypothetical protein